MSPDPDRSDEEQDIDQPALAAAADAILDGQEVDWTALASPESPDAAMARQLRVLADLAAVHRKPGASWAHLQIIEKVGEGAFGEVFRAWDPHLNRDVALKLLGPPQAGGANDRSWVIAEARFLAAIRHNNVVTVYGADRVDGRVGFWTEYIRGRTLAELIHDHGVMTAEEASAVGIDVCRALSAVHAAGLLHRDIKANNVMREDGGRVVLLDFGASRNFVQEAAADGIIGDPHGPTGTPLYTAPELWRDGASTPRSDIYSLGVLLYFLTTGTYPVRGNTVRDVGEAHRNGQWVALRDERRDLPEAFVDVVQRAIDPDPAKRFESIGALEAALATACTAIRAAVPPAVPPRTNWRNVGAAAGVVALLGWAGIVLWPGGNAAAERTAPEQALAASAEPAKPDPPTQQSTPQAQPPASPPPAPPLTRITFPPDVVAGRPSHDGQFYPYVAGSGSVWVLDVLKDRSFRVVEKGPDEDRTTSTLMSPTGDRVAYVSAFMDGTQMLRVVNWDGSASRVLIQKRRDQQIFLQDWSRDGREILCWIEQGTGTTDLVLVSVVGGPHRVLTSKIEGRRQAVLSPDGHFVVAERVIQDPSGVSSRLLILGTDNTDSEPRVLVENALSPAWTPDGRGLAFLRYGSMNGDSQDLWIAPIVDGSIPGEPAQVLPNIGATLIPITITDSGMLNAIISSSVAEVYVATFDPTAIVPVKAARRIHRTEIDRHSGPSWSPDGQAIAYFSGRENPIPGAPALHTLTIQDTASGKSRRVATNLAVQRNFSPEWLDEHTVIVWGADQDERSHPERLGYYRVDLRSRQASAFLIREQTPVVSQPPLRVLPDRTGVLYLRSKTGIVAHSFGTGNERVIVPANAWSGIGRFDVSRDGTIAFQAHKAKRSTLLVQDIGGEPREVLHADEPEGLEFHSWTPGGQHLVYSRTKLDRPNQSLWIVPLSGHEPRDLGLSLPRQPNPISVHPDGALIAYPERLYLIELWIRPLPKTLFSPGGPPR